MDNSFIIRQLSQNAGVFYELLRTCTPDEYLWKPEEKQWCLLEIVCHLRDEEVEDFRARVTSVLLNPEKTLTPIDPAAWVTERNYIENDFNKVLQNFIDERADSCKWLQSLANPKWNNVYMHPKLGSLSAQLFLNNWLAHDMLHIRQINRAKYLYFLAHSDEPLDYAGNW